MLCDMDWRHEIEEDVVSVGALLIAERLAVTRRMNWPGHGDEFGKGTFCPSGCWKSDLRVFLSSTRAVAAES